MEIMNSQTAVGATLPFRFPKGYTEATIEVDIKSLGTNLVSACEVKLQGTNTNPWGNRNVSGANYDNTGSAHTGLISSPAIAIGTTPENVANGAFDYRINGTNYSKAAVAAGTAIGTGYDISDTKYGGFAIFIDTAGTVTFSYPATVQAYASAALAHAAIDAIATPLNKCRIGKVLIYNNTGAVWDSQTDDLTDASGVTTADFYSELVPFYDIATHTFDAAEITAQKALFHIDKQHAKWGRLYLSTLTNAGEITSKISFR